MKQERSTLPRHKSHSRYHHRASEYKKKLNTLLLTPCRSSLTVEAALALTLVILASVVLMVPMLILNHQRNAALEMHENARQMAKQKYVEYYRAKDGSLTLDQDLLNSGETVLTALGLGHQISQPGMKNIDLLSDSEITKETVRYIANYDAVLPFSVLGLDHLSQQVVVSRRAWIGAKGNRWMENNGGETEDDPVVYVSTRDTDVYHTTRACSYLTHDILEARASEQIRRKVQSLCHLPPEPVHADRLLYAGGTQLPYDTELSHHLQQRAGDEKIRSRVLWKARLCALRMRNL